MTAGDQRRSWLQLTIIEGSSLVVALGIIVFFFKGNVRVYWPILPGALALGLGVFAFAFRYSRGRADRFYREEFEGVGAPIDDDGLRVSGRDTGAGLFQDYLDAGRKLLQTERYEEAVEILKKASELDPGQSKVHNYLGIAYARLNRNTESIECYCRAISLDYDYAGAHFNLALAYENEGLRREAIDQWRRYLDIGEVVGEREELLESARQRIRDLSSQ